MTHPGTTQPFGASPGAAALATPTQPGSSQPDPTQPSPEASTPAAPALRVTQRRSIPDGVASNSKQDVIIAADTSSSMRQRGKIGELNQGIFALQSVLAGPENKNGFRLSLLEFNNGADVKIMGEMAQSVKLPKLNASGGTNFDAALKKGLSVVEDLAARANPEGWHWLRPHFFFLSDGHSSVTDRNIAALQELADITAIAYGADADQRTLARIASDGDVHTVGTNGGELRRFLAAVGQTLSQGLAAAR